MGKGHQQPEKKAARVAGLGLLHFALQTSLGLADGGSNGRKRRNRGYCCFTLEAQFDVPSLTEFFVVVTLLQLLSFFPGLIVVL